MSNKKESKKVIPILVNSSLPFSAFDFEEKVISATKNLNALKVTTLFLQKQLESISTADELFSLFYVSEHLQLTKELCQETILLKKSCINDDGSNALIIAIKQENRKIAKTLIRLGINVNSSNAGGETPLILATWNGMIDLIELLLQEGANPNHMDNCKRTALIYAIRSGNERAALLLIEAGAQIDIPHESPPAQLASLYGLENVYTAISIKKKQIHL